MSFNLIMSLIILLRNNGKPVVPRERNDNCQYSFDFKAASAFYFFRVESPVASAASPFEYQINKRVARLCTSCDLVRFFSPSSRHVVVVFVVAVLRFLYGCTEKAMPVHTASADAAVALLGMHRSRHGGERRRWRRIELVIRSRRY